MENSISKSKTELTKLEESGEFIFHGSALKLDVLEPRQAYTLSKKGYVYVLYRKDFLPKGGHQKAMDWRCGIKVKPVRAITVTSENLPKNIKIIKD